MWDKYTPPAEEQISDPLKTNNFSDSEGCVSFSAIHCIESQEIKLYGWTKEYSERALAKLSGTSAPGVGNPPYGNSITNVFDAIKTYGLILEKDWPTPKSFTLQEFYADIPPEIVVKGKEFLNQYDVELMVKNPNINEAPFWTEILIDNSDTHFVEQLNETTYFDSYQKYIKAFDVHHQIINQFAIIIKPKQMSNTQFVHKQGTQEYGFYVPALSEDALKDKALNMGINILNPDGSIDFNAAKQISGL